MHGKSTEITRGGRQVPLAKISRHLARKNKGHLLHADSGNILDPPGSITEAPADYRIRTPPPTIPFCVAPPENFRIYEEIMTAARAWVCGSFESGKWSVDSDGNVIFGGFHSSDVFHGVFLPNFVTGAKALGKGKPEASRLLDQAFDALSTAIRLGDYRVLSWVCMESIVHLDDVEPRKRLTNMLWNFARELWTVVHGPNDPVSRLWWLMGRLLPTSEAWDAVIGLVRCIAESFSESFTWFMENKLSVAVGRVFQAQRTVQRSTRESGHIAPCLIAHGLLFVLTKHILSLTGSDEAQMIVWEIAPLSFKLPLTIRTSPGHLDFGTPRR